MHRIYRFLLVLVCLLFIVRIAGAQQSQGPNSAGSGANVATGGVAWSTPFNIGLSDDLHANVSLFLQSSYWLYVTDFGFCIPNGATIDSVVVVMEKSAGTDIRDADVQLLKDAGPPTGSNHAKTLTPWPSTDAYVAYSGHGTWGVSLTSAIVNSPDFGVAIRVENGTFGFQTANIDHILITVYYSGGSGLLGEYTIDGSQAASATNYRTFSAAAEDLSYGTRSDGGPTNGPGVACKVNFEVATGTYNEQFVLDNIVGTSPSKTISFSSATNDRKDVVVQYQASVADSNYVVDIIETPYVDFEALTLKALGEPFGYSRVVVLEGVAKKIKFSDCSIEAFNTSSTGDNRALVFAVDSFTQDSIEFQYCDFLNGAIGIDFRNPTMTADALGTIINGCYFGNQRHRAMELGDHTAIKITQNQVVADNATISYRGIYCDRCSYDFEARNNKVSINTGHSAISFTSGSGSLGQMGLIANNFASIHNSSAESRTLFIAGSDYINVYNNSVLTNSNHPNAAAFSYPTSGNNINIQNNIFYNKGTGGYAIFINNATTVNVLDNNDHFSNSANLGHYDGVDYPTLTLWKPATGKDASSVSFDPVYQYDSLLYLTVTTPAELYDNAANLSPVITDDVDGKPRLGFWMGAHEANPPSRKYYVNDLNTPGDTFTTAIGAPYGTNFGMSPSDPITSIQDIFDNYDINENDTIYIDAGSYVENVNISIADAGSKSFPVVIIGAGPGVTNWREASGVGLDMFNTSGYEISNIRFENVGAALSLIRIAQSEDISFSDCSFFSAANLDMIRIENIGGNNSNNLYFSQCTFSLSGPSSPTAISFSGDDMSNRARFLKVESCTFDLSFAGGNSIGLDLTKVDSAEISKSRFIRGWRGLRMNMPGGATNTEIFNNYFSENVKGIAVGAGVSNDNTLQFNSFYTMEACVDFGSSGANLGWDVRNNIFQTTGGGGQFCLEITGSSKFDFCDYNVFWNPGGEVVQFDGANYPDVTTWSTIDHSEEGINNGDENSLEVDPRFLDPTGNNLDLEKGSPVVEAGFSILSIEEDINGEERNDPPTIGAYESSNGFYVNDNSQAGDIYTTIVGSDVPGCGEPGHPCRSLKYVLDNNDLTFKDTIFVDAGDYTDEGIMTANDEGVTILGAGKNTTTFDGASYGVIGRWMQINVGSHNMTISDITVKNYDISGFASSGAAILFNANTTDELTLLNCAFERCKGVNGGAVFFDGDTLVSIGNKFDNNESTGDGGGLHMPDIANVTYLSSNDTFISNEASGVNGEGGAIYFGSTNNANIKNGIIGEKSNGNKSVRHGGGIYFDGDTLMISKTLIAGDSVTGASRSGGGIYVNSCNLLFIDSSEISNNYCTLNGGGIYYNTVSDSVFINNSRISNNHAGSRGGGIYANDPTIILNSNIDSNLANTGGGGIYQFGDFLYIENSSFKGDTSGTGGAIYGDGTSESITTINTQFEANKVSNSGAGVCLANGATGTFSGGNFLNNISVNSGGALFLGGLGSRGYLNGITIDNNTRGAVYLSSDARLEADSVVFINNASTNGAAIRGMTSSDIIISNSILGTQSEGNRVTNQGGAIHFIGDSLVINHSEIAGNSSMASQGGGAFMFSGGSTVIIDECDIHHNYTDNGSNTADGGAILAYTTEAHISKTIFYENYAEDDGSAIMVDNASATVTLENCLLYKDTAETQGIIYYNSGSGSISNCTFADNVSNTSNAAIYSNNTGNVINVQNSIFYGNTGRDFSQLNGAINVSYSLYDNASAGTDFTDNGNNITGQDPLFNSSVTNDYTLQEASPAIDVGTATGAPAVDINDTIRPKGNGFDLGAYESNFSTPLELTGAGEALDFDGNDDYVNVGSTVTTSLIDVTIEAWFKWNGTGSGTVRYIMMNGHSTNNGYGFFMNAANQLLFRLGNGTSASTAYIPTPNKWTHFAATRRIAGGTWEIYVDGQLRATNNNTPAFPSGDLTIGSREFGTSNFPGQIDEVRIWESELTTAEIRNWMCRKVTDKHPKYSDLVAYYRFDDTTGTTLTDYSGNANHGVLNAMNPATDWVTSGAALGDTSVYLYGGSPVNYTFDNGGVLSLGDFTGAIDGMHIYEVNDSILIDQLPSGISSYDQGGYVGVFKVGDANAGYRPTYNYTGTPLNGSGNEDRVRLLKRQNGADNTWKRASGQLRTNTDNNTISSGYQYGTEYVLGYANSTYPDEPGSGYATRFNSGGSNDEYVAVVPDASLDFGTTRDFTVEMWVKIDDPQTPVTGLLSKANQILNIDDMKGFQLVVNTNTFGAEIGDGLGGLNTAVISTSTIIDDQQPHHLVLSVDRSINTARLYVDGVVEVTVADPVIGQDLTVGDSLFIGTNRLMGEYFDGYIDEVRIWDTLMPESIIRKYMCNKTLNNHPAESRLLAYWRFDDGLIDTLEDLVTGKDGFYRNAENTDRQLSIAPIGDTSVFAYAGVPMLSMLSPSSGQMNLQAFPTGLADSVHLYFVSDTPNNIVLPTGVDSFELSGYWGTYRVGNHTSLIKHELDYTTNPKLNGAVNEASIRLGNRNNNASGSWAVDSFTIADISSNTIYSIYDGNSTGRQEQVIPMYGPGYTFDVDSLEKQDTVFCQGQSFRVYFSSTGIEWPPIPFDTFYAELSDAGGSFTSPDTIGMIVSDVDSFINVVIPIAQVPGITYRIRIQSSVPSATSTDNGYDLTIANTNNYYVNDGSSTNDMFTTNIGIDEPGCGCPSNPCRTVQYVLDNNILGGDTIFIDAGSYPDANIMVNYDDTAVFIGADSSLTVFDGSILGTNMIRAFRFDSTLINLQKVTIKNYDSRGIASEPAGGGVKIKNAQGNCIIDEVVIVDNLAQGAGGIMFENKPNTDATLYLSNSKLDGNYANGRGGAIRSFDRGGFSNLKVENSKIGTLNGNESVSGGGGIYFEGDTLIINNSLFSKNTTSDNGGAVYINDNYATISKTTFRRDSAMGHGGAIYATNNTVLLISDSTRVGIGALGNYANQNGGGIYFDGDDLTVRTSYFISNEASNGGAVYSLAENSTTIQNRSNIGLNTAALDGAGIYIDGQNAQRVYIDNTDIGLNDATGNGGGVYVANNGGSASLYISGLSAIGNLALANTANNGAGVYFDGDTLSLDTAIVSGNIADSNGGALYIENGYVDISICAIEQNAALNNNGGGIYTSSNNPMIMRGTVIDSSFAKENGGALYAATGANILMTNNTLIGVTGKKNRARNGGGIYFNGDSLTITNNSAITSNVASLDGGGIYFAGNELNIQNSNINIDSAGQLGGGIYVHVGNANLNTTNIDGNISTNGGGGVFFFDGDTLKLTASTISRNRVRASSPNDGGAGVRISDGLAIITKCIFDSNYVYNHAAADGGAMKIGGIVKVFQSQFFDNIAPDDGSVVFLGATDSVYLENCLVYDNIAGDDGAIKGIGSSGIEIVNSTIIDNYSTNSSSGGVVTETFAKVDIINSIVYNNETFDFDVLGGNITVDHSIYNMSNGATIFNSSTSYPIFVDSMNNDFSIANPLSPAYNGGISLNAPIVDIVDSARPQKGIWDIGAYEAFFADTLYIDTMLSGLLYCQGDNLEAVVVAVNTYNAASELIFQISDNAGSFASPTNLDTITGFPNVPDTFSVNIPSMLSGTGYRVRAISLNPNFIGIDNGQDISIGQPLLVTSTADDSTCGTLRYAIGYANANPGADTITFDTVAMGGHTIAIVNGQLPLIFDDSTVINGDLSMDGKPDVEIWGGSLNNSEIGLRIQSSYNEIRGLVINQFDSVALEIAGAGSIRNRIVGNYINTDYSGMVDSGRGHLGISINDANSNFIGDGTLVGRNLIAGATTGGGFGSEIRLNNSSGNIVIGNYIGTNITLSGPINAINDLVNVAVRIAGTSSGNIIGDTSLNQYNVIVGRQKGIEIIGDSNIIRGNYVGTDTSETIDMGTIGGGNGINIQSSSNIINYNVIAHHEGSGIRYPSAASSKNMMHQNRFWDNGINRAIWFQVAGVQENIKPPIINNLSADSTLSGTSSPNAFIQIYADSTFEGQIFVDTTRADAAGDWSIQIDLSSLPANVDTLRALQDSLENTSDFSLEFFIDICNNPLLVTSAADDSSCGTLRRAIGYANNNFGADTITFDTIAMGGHTITILSALPDLIDDSTYINGDLNNNNRPDVELYGANVGPITNGLEILSSTNTIKGLVINRFSASGILINTVNARNNTIISNYLGTDYSGLADSGNALDGVRIDNGASNNNIGIPGQGNLLSANTERGCHIISANCHNNIISGNFIGTDVTGNVALGNGFQGISIDADSNQIGLAVVGGGNVIAGNNGENISTSVSKHNILYNNNIGLALDGITVFSAGSASLLIFNDSNQIGGFDPMQANNIRGGNSLGGIYMLGKDNLIHGNSIAQNVGLGIDFNPGAQEGILPPKINNVTVVGTDTIVSGTASPNALIQIYCDSAHEGQAFLDTTLADATGNWSKVINGYGVYGTNGLDSLTALQDSAGNTSKFSAPYFKMPETLGPNYYVNDVLGGDEKWTSATGVDAVGCGTPSNPCRTVQFVLDQYVLNNDTIFIDAGTYPDTNTTITSDVAVFYGVISGGVHNTIFDGTTYGANDKSAFLVQTSGNVFKSIRIRKYNASASPSGSGGALAISGFRGITTLDSMVVDSNLATQGGGVAMVALVGDTNILVIQNSNLVQNQASIRGGAVFADNLGGSFSILIDETNLGDFGQGNAANRGGGLWVSGAEEIVFSNSTIRENIALTGSGGGIFARNSYIVIDSTNINQNRSARDGGGVYFQTSDVNDSLFVTPGSDVSFNKADSVGGGMYIETNSIALIANTLFWDNRAFHGGGIGMPATGSGNLVLQSVFFQRDSSLRNGGAVFVDSNNTIVSISSTYFASIARRGGAIFNNGSASLSQNTIELNRTFNSAANSFGGGIYNAGRMTVGNTAIENNFAHHAGGGIFSGLNSDLYLINNTNVGAQFGGNKSFEGGGLYFNGDTLYAQDVSFEGDSANAGGAIYLARGNATLVSVRIDSNIARINGGGINQANNSSLLGLDDVSLIDNEANIGAGIYSFVPGGSIKILNSIIGNAAQGGNISNTSAGGIYFASDSLVIDSSDIAFNNASSSGGGIELAELANFFSISNSEIHDNNANVLGGGLWIRGSGYASKVRAYNNTSNRGAFLASSGNTGSDTFNLVNSLIYENIALIEAVIFDDEQVTNLLNTTIADNQSLGAAPLSGGIVTTGTGQISAFNTILHGNSVMDARENGGGAIIADHSIFDSISIGVVTTNSVNGNPLFTDAVNDDYTIDTSTSPAVNSGDNSYVAAISTDLDNNDRIIGGIVDMGAFEFVGATITIDSVSPDTTCAGTNLYVCFSKTGTFNLGNVFSVELSDSNGSFSSPTVIDTIIDTVGQCRFIDVPDTIPAGDGYRIRIVSSDPIITGLDNGTDIVITPSSSSAFTGLDSTYCTSSFLQILNPVNPGGTFFGVGIKFSVGLNKWYFDPEEAGIGTHIIGHVICDTTFDTTTILPAPCVDDVVNDSTEKAIKDPQGLFTDCDGQIYTTQPTWLVEVDTFGNASLIAGDSSTSGYRDGYAFDPIASKALMDQPFGIVKDPTGLIYFVDVNNHTVRLLRNDSVITVVGNGSAGTSVGPGVSARLSAPYGLCFSPSLDALYVAQEGGFAGAIPRVKRIDLLSGDYNVTNVIGGGGMDIALYGVNIAASDARLYRPRHIISDNDYLYIADEFRNAIYRYEYATDSITLYAGNPPFPGFTDGTLSEGAGQGGLWLPNGVSVTCNGEVFVADKQNQAIRKIDLSEDSLTTFAGALGISGDVTGSAEDARFNDPTAVSAFIKGFIDVADTRNNKIKRVSLVDWNVSPWNGLDSIYCTTDDPDTSTPFYVCNATYSGPGMSSSGVFDPAVAGAGLHTIQYNYTIGYCGSILTTTIRVVDGVEPQLQDTAYACGLDSVMLDVGLGFDSILWSTTDTTQTITVNTPGLYTVAVTDTNGCMSTDQTEVLPSTPPVVDAGNDTGICIGDTLVLGGIPTGSSAIGILSYQWTPDTFFVDADTVANPRVVALFDTTYIVTVADSNGCASIDTIDVVVNDRPNTNAGVDDTICSGDSIQLNSTASTGLMPYSYQWLPTDSLSNDTIANPWAYPIDTTDYIVTITDANGCSNADTVNILVLPGLTLSLTNDTGICLGDTTTLLAAVAGGTMPYSIQWTPSDSLDCDTCFFTMAWPTSTTSYIFTVVDTYLCSAQDSVQITVNANPIADAGADDSLCIGDTVLIGSLFGSSGGTSPYSYQWAPSDSLSNDTIFNPLAFPTTTTEYQLQVTDANGCIGVDSVNVRVDSLPTIAGAGVDTVLCNGTNLVLYGNTPLVGNGLWQILSGSGNLVDSSQPTTTINGLLFPDTIDLEWSISNGICPTSRDSMTIYNINPLDPNVVISVSPNDTICEGTSVTFSLSTAVDSGLTPSYQWLLNGVNITGATNIHYVTDSLKDGDSVQLIMTVSENCFIVQSDTSTTIQMTVDTLPSAAVVGVDTTICDTFLTLYATNPVVGAGRWSVLSGMANVVNDLNPISLVNEMAYGDTVELQWRVANGMICPSNRDTLTITILDLPTAADAGEDTAICDTVITLYANTPTVGVGNWMLLSGTGNIVNPLDPTSQLDGLVRGDTVVLEWSISNGICTVSRDTIEISVLDLPTVADAGVDTVLCNGTNLVLYGNTPIVGNGLWQILSGSGSLVAPTSPTSNVNSLLFPDTIDLEWSISNGICPVSRDSMRIYNINPLNPDVTISVSPNDTICEGTSVTFSLSTAVDSGLSPSYQWLLNGVNITGATNMHYVTDSLKDGDSVQLIMTVSENCFIVQSDTSTAIQITVDTLPTIADAGVDTVLCNGTNLVLYGNTPIVGNGLWQILSGSGNLVDSSQPTTTINGLLFPDTIGLEWSISNGICPTSRDSMTIYNINPLDPNVVISVSPNDTICEGTSVTFNLSTAVDSGLTPSYQWLLNGVNITGATNIHYVTDSLKDGDSVQLIMTVSENCFIVQSDTSTAIQMTVDTLPSAAVVGVDTTICDTFLTLYATNPDTGIGMWSIVSGTANIVANTDPLSLVNQMNYGNTVELGWEISSGVCPSNRDTLTITILDLPTAADAGEDTTICDTMITLYANTPTVGAGNWMLLSGAGNIVNPLDPVSQLDGLVRGDTVVLEWSISNGICTVSRDTIEISVLDLPTVADAGVDTVLCNGTNLVLYGNTPIVGNGLWQILSGTGSLVNASLPSATIGGLVAPDNIELEWSIDNGVCPATRDTMEIFNINPLNPSITIQSNDVNDTICIGDTVVFSIATVTDSGFTPNYQWLLNGVAITGATGLTYITDTLTDGDNIELALTVAENCFINRSDTSNIITIRVSNGVLADAGNDTAICLDQSVMIGGSPTAIGGLGSILYAWSPILSLDNFAISNPTAQPLATTEYFVRVTDAGGCFTVDSITVQVSNPVADAGVNDTICDGDVVSIGGTPSASGGLGGYTYLWSPADSINNTSIANPLVFPTSNTTYQLLITDSIGCPATDSVIISVSAPVADAGSDTTVCMDNIITLGGVTVSSGGFAPYTYLWSPNTGFIDPNTDSNPQVNPIDTTYVIVITDVAGCMASDSVTLMVNPLPIADAGLNDTICIGDNIMIGGAPTASGTTGSYVYNWTPTGGFIANPTDSNPTVTGDTTRTYAVVVVDTNGCMASDSVEVFVIPSFSIAISDTALCFGDSVQLSVTGGVSYQWAPSRGLSDSTIGNPMASPDSTTIYRVIASSNQCPSDSGFITVTVHPAVDVNIVPGDTLVVIGAEIQLDGTTRSGEFYTWSPLGDLDDDKIPTPITIPLFDSVTYSLEVIDSNGCYGYDTITITVQDVYEVFVPNLFTPNGDGVNDELCVENYGIEELEFKVFNKWGNEVFITADPSICWDGTMGGDPLDADTYAYYLRYVTFGGEEIMGEGTITLIR